ncbi:hypothetical protein [Paraflavitalea pollutisoli]|uniref:hypothetical protein n=1 Tax=Paraflavitalea pollutisoli TaxID=3034143 RepID=UPI0023EABCDC|nr:hypothetical protein [Paraflavitalea sp. H1-2-19X]
MIKAWFLLVTLLLFTTNDILAQSHVTTTGSFCRYAKNSLRNKNVYAEGHTQCPACDAEDAKEAVARKAEDKRRADAKAAERAAAALEKKRAEDALLKKKWEEANKGSTELAVTMPANKTTANVPSAVTPAVINGMAAGYLYDEGETDNQSVGKMSFSINQGERNNQIYKLYSDINYFVLNNKRILDNDEFKVCIGVRRIPGGPQNNPTKFPPGVGIVILNETAGKHVIADLIDAKGERLLKDNNISTIVHFFGDYFILLEGEVFSHGGGTSYGFSDGVIYNYKTKQRYPLAKYGSKRNRVNVAWQVNATYLSKDKLREKSTYSAFVEVITDWQKSMFYYITHDGKVESDDINW